MTHFRDFRDVYTFAFSDSAIVKRKGQQDGDVRDATDRVLTAKDVEYVEDNLAQFFFSITTRGSCSRKPRLLLPPPRILCQQQSTKVRAEHSSPPFEVFTHPDCHDSPSVTSTGRRFQY